MSDGVTKHRVCGSVCVCVGGCKRWSVSVISRLLDYFLSQQYACYVCAAGCYQCFHLVDLLIPGELPAAPPVMPAHSVGSAQCDTEGCLKNQTCYV